MHAPAPRVPRSLILAGDLASFSLALVITLLLRYGTRLGEGTNLQDHVIPFGFLFAIWLVTFGVAGLYRPQRLSASAPLLSTLFFAMVVNTALGAVFFYLSPWWAIEPRTNLALVILFATALLFLWRLAVRKAFSSESFTKTLVALGTPEEMAQIHAMIQGAPRSGYHLLEHLPHRGEILSGNPIAAVVLGQSAKHDPKVLEMLAATATRDMEIFDAASFAEYLSEQVPVGAIDDRWVLENLLGERARISDFMKHSSDITAALVLLPVLVALAPFLAIAIVLDYRGPVFFRQRRVGSRGKIFHVWKFRTMIPEAEKIGPNWTEQHDTRVTRIGRFLRKTHVDELPQIVNILRGDMSFIGPRPERPEFVDVLKKKLPYYSLRHLVRPGLSGWAQVNYHYTATVDESLQKLQYDLYYIKHRSLLFDLLIAARSAKLLFGWGSR